MGKKSAATVQPVDPVATAKAQSTSNIETAREQQRLNMVNTVGPDGSVSYAADPNAPGGYSQTTSLSPAQQAIYNSSTQAQAGALGVANTQLGRVSQALGQPLSTAGLPGLVGGVGTWGQPTSTYSGSGATSPQGGKVGGASQAMPAGGGTNPQGGKAIGASNPMPSAGGAQPGGSPAVFAEPGVDNFSRPASGAGPTGGKGGGAVGAMPHPSGGGSPSGVPNVPGAFQPTTLAQLAMPSTDGIQSSFRTGGPLQYDFSPGQSVQGHVGPQDLNSAYQSAANASYQQAASRLDPQYAQQQSQLEAKLAAQGLGQNSEAYKSAVDTFSRGRNDAYAQAQFGSQAAGLNAENTIFGQSLNQGQFANAAAGQQYAQNQGQAAFNNQTAGQDYSQNLGAAQFANQAQQQGYGQQLSNVQNLAALQNQGFNQYQTSQNQGFNQGLANAQLANTARQQGLQEQAYIQNMPINQFTSLLGSGQVSMPNGISYSPTQVANTDVLGAYALNQQGQVANAQAQNAARGGMMGGLFSLGSAAIMASDRRLKTDIQRIGTRSDGLGVYLYRYKGDKEPRVGVMAQEVKRVRPDAVIRRRDGFLAVNYLALEAA